MHRRNFTKNLLLAGSLPLLNKIDMDSAQSSRSLLKPKGLRPGDTLGLITPGSALSEEQYEEAFKQVKELGFDYKPGKHIYKKNGFLAGKDGERIEDIHMMIEDPDIDAIWCLRGGYGCARLLPNLDYNLIRNNPKLIMGYSDITVLQMAIYTWSRIVSFHSPVVVSEMTDYTTKQFYQQVHTRSGASADHTI